MSKINISIVTQRVFRIVLGLLTGFLIAPTVTMLFSQHVSELSRNQVIFVAGGIFLLWTLYFVYLAFQIKDDASNVAIRDITVLESGEIKFFTSTILWYGIFILMLIFLPPLVFNGFKTLIPNSNYLILLTFIIFSSIELIAIRVYIQKRMALQLDSGGILLNGSQKIPWSDIQHLQVEYFSSNLASSPYYKKIKVFKKDGADFYFNGSTLSISEEDLVRVMNDYCIHGFAHAKTTLEALK